ncbi:MAG: hypothetical protein CMO80_02035 [Verrucomicrobiales bacterium]|nr:hypothetical protein [Verrucomicrobiales bacterium]|tara:strand:- start:2185 stop:2580 length:396 start_codon:yes stop_codon:yes gene_type:complete
MKNLPLSLAGGRFKHGQHLPFDRANNHPLTNLYVSMLQRLGLETDPSSTGTKRLRGVESDAKRIQRTTPMQTGDPWRKALKVSALLDGVGFPRLRPPSKFDRVWIRRPIGDGYRVEGRNASHPENEGPAED